MLQDEIVSELRKRGEELLARPPVPVVFTGDPDADVLLNDLENHPHAFVLACIMHQQIKAEKAWLIPYAIRDRLGTFAFNNLRRLSIEEVTSLMRQPSALHRFADRMSRFLHAGIQRIGRDYGGDAARIWSGRPASDEMIRRFLEFDGVGPKIACMTANILVRDFKIPVRDKYCIDISADVHVQRVFARLGLVSSEGEGSPELTIYRARELNPEYPGVFDLSVWEIGREWCRPTAPLCPACYMNRHCPTASARRGSGNIA